jgi:hypothetical protein
VPCSCVLLAYLVLPIWDGLPRTLHFQIDSWQNNSWGFYDIDRGRTQCEVAIASDGSRMNRCEHDSYRHYFIPQERVIYHSVYSRSENAGFRLDDLARTAYGGHCRCTWDHFRTIADDEECTRTADVRLPGAKNVGEAEVAGHRVVRYRGVDQQSTEIHISLAPSLDCELMEEVRTSPGMLGIPAAKWRYYVTAYRPGEPDRNLFLVPPGYGVKR